MVAVCDGVRKSGDSTSGRFITSNGLGDLDLEFLVRVEPSDAIRKFSLNVVVVAVSKSDAKKVPVGWPSARPTRTVST
jgi:hypothetical protein